MDGGRPTVCFLRRFRTTAGAREYRTRGVTHTKWKVNGKGNAKRTCSAPGRETGHHVTLRSRRLAAARAAVVGGVEGRSAAVGTRRFSSHETFVVNHAIHDGVRVLGRRAAGGRHYPHSRPRRLYACPRRPVVVNRSFECRFGGRLSALFIFYSFINCYGYRILSILYSRKLKSQTIE